jgi:N,N-dimethylformamidase beta subunit-like, C-terminal
VRTNASSGDRRAFATTDKRFILGHCGVVRQGVTTVLAAGAVVAATAVGAFARPPVRLNPIQLENARVGSTNWLAPDTVDPAIEGYASEISLAPGDTLHLHVSTAPAMPYRIAVYRLGWYSGRGARLVACVPSDCSATEPGAAFAARAPDPVTGVVRTAWPVTDSVQTDVDWTSGYYLARLAVPATGDAANVFFVVREAPTHASTVLVEAPVNTWQAYNSWGGRSLYVATDGGPLATRVSFDRPWSPGSQWQFVRWGIHLVRFLEREGYDVSYTTDVDVDRDPAELLHHALVIVDGHGEYWTSGIRDAFETARDAGVNLMFMGANIGYWQVRYEDDRRTVVGYKTTPDPETDQRLRSTLFRSLDPARYECSLLGVMHMGAIERTGVSHDYSVEAGALGDKWFADTGFTAASTLPGLVGPEWDQVVDPRRAWSCNFANLGLTTFFHYDGQPGDADAVRYTAPSGSVVFSAGSLQLESGLDSFGGSAADPRLQQFVRNALHDLCRRRSGGWHPGPSWPFLS